MIQWASFLSVFLVSLGSACAIVAVFALGLRLIGADGGWRRPAGVVAFVICGAGMLYGVYLVIPFLHR